MPNDQELVPPHTVVPPCSDILLLPRAQNVLCWVALGCSHCDVVNPTLQFRRIGYQSAVALSSPMGKSSESVQCAITGPCLRMRHRPSA